MRFDSGKIAAKTVEGVTFFRIAPTEWQSEDGTLRVHRNGSGTTFTAIVDGHAVRSDVTDSGNAVRFQTLIAAMSAAVRRGRGA
ncbi:MAG: hypothetical protein J2P55_12170 [Rhizobiales bacterium]|nr:hypothetical protein [Hyphomicrobiales bacterium]